MAGAFASDLKGKLDISPKVEEAPKVTIMSKMDESRHMKAVEWHGTKDMRVNFKRPVPLITDPTNIVVRVTSTANCGSDLRLYLGSMPGIVSGDIVSHEFMGVVAAVGPEVTGLQKGDRVITCFEIACGQCRFREGASTFTCCNKTGTSTGTLTCFNHTSTFTCCNDTGTGTGKQTLFGSSTAGFFGFWLLALLLTACIILGLSLLYCVSRKKISSSCIIAS